MAKELQNADMIMNVMNRSHGDSLIGIVKHYGNLEKTVGVSITSIDTEGFDCMVNLSDGSNSFTRIIFTEPLGGKIFIISGGVTSFGPPEGDCIAAQDMKIIVQREWRNIESSFMLNLVSIHINRKLFAECHLIFC